MNDYELNGGVVAGDGGSARIGEDELNLLKDITEQIGRDVSEYVATNRSNSADVRYCSWEGQSDDGRKHKKALGKDPLPFDGASDSRIALADKIVNEHVREYRLAAQRVVPQVVGMEGSDGGRAGKLRTLLRYLIRNLWDDYERQISLIGQYMEGDDPGVGVMGVYWRRERALKSSVIVPEDLILIYVQAMQEAGLEINEEQVDYLIGLFESEENAEELKELVRFIHPQMERQRVNKVVKELYADGEAEFPEPYIRENTPVLEAHRLFDDIFVPINTTSIQRATVVIRRDWYSRAEVLAKAAADGWSKAFTDELLGSGVEEKGFAGLTAFDDEHREYGSGTIDLSQFGGGERFAGLYEVLTAYSREVTKDGVPGVYVRKFSWFCEKAATERELLGYSHGKYPFVVFAREYLNSVETDSRGIPKLVQTQQSSLKLHNDTLEDHVQVNTNPPIKVPPNKPRFQLTLQPFGQIQANARENVEYMQPPAYPRAAVAQRDWVENDVNDYFGRQSEKVPPEIALEARQDRVNHFLDCLRRSLHMAVQLCQQYMTDEEIMRIVGGNGLPLARSVEEIQGQFDMYLSYDARDMDLEYLQKKADLFMTYVRSLDQRATVQYDKVVKRIFESLDPNWAEEALIEPQQADERERNEEKGNLAMILNGIRPDRPEQGQNHRLRLQVLEEELQARMQNPQAFDPLSPAAQQLLQEQVEFRQFQVQQEENAQTGRRGVVEEDLGNLET